jgi:hypothetical protein
MIKSLCLLSLSLLFTTGAFSGDIKKASPQTWFPLTIGSIWQYRVVSKDHKEKFEMSVSIDPPEKYDGREFIIMTQKDKRGRMRSFLTKTSEGIFCKKTGLKKSISPELDAVHKPDIPLFLFNVTPGHTFHWEGSLKVAWVNKKIVLDGKIIGLETITVPAGTFDCVKIYFHQKRDNEISDEYAWYAQGVGQVKYSGGQYVKELTSYDIKH